MASSRPPGGLGWGWGGDQAWGEQRELWGAVGTLGALEKAPQRHSENLWWEELSFRTFPASGGSSNL